MFLLFFSYLWLLMQLEPSVPFGDLIILCLDYYDAKGHMSGFSPIARALLMTKTLSTW